MSNINNGGQAFPSGLVENENNQVDALHKGMTLRDYFAAKAMQAMASSPEHCSDGWAHSDIAIQAYELADAMLRARGEA